MKKRFVLILSVVVMFFPLTNKAEGMTGAGTVDNPYVIWDVNDLQNMQSDLTAYYELGQNINASVTSGWNGGLGFAPIGSISDEFTGSFDGKGYKITSLTINRPTEKWVGLFSYTMGGEIKNVGLEDCSVNAKQFVGALAGGGDGAGFLNSYSTGTVSAIQGSVGGLLGYSYAPVEDCYSTCDVTSTGGAYKVSEVGGLIGTVVESVTNSYATGNVIATSDGDIDQVGGFVGLETSWNTLISRSYAAGNVFVTAGERAGFIGGFVGEDASNYSDCYARGDINVTAGNSTAWGYVGGFIGINYPDVLIDNCYSTGSATVTAGLPYIGGFCGGNYGTITDSFWDIETSGTIISDGGTGLETSDMIVADAFITAGWNEEETIWHLGDDDYPYLQAGSPIPEPSVLLLFGGGILGLFAFKRRISVGEKN